MSHLRGNALSVGVAATPMSPPPSRTPNGIAKVGALWLGELPSTQPVFMVDISFSTSYYQRNIILPKLLPAENTSPHVRGTTVGDRFV